MELVQTDLEDILHRALARLEKKIAPGFQFRALSKMVSTLLQKDLSGKSAYQSVCSVPEMMEFQAVVIKTTK
jgi:hypothetical protein